jgi:predicted acylesterase/phospholipase RssA
VAYRILTRDEHFTSKGPKRILALDGGGLRGILSLGILKHLEQTLRSRHGNDAEFRLCHYFDLIAGTSTGAIIAAALATGMSVGEVIAHYQQLGREVFTRDWLRLGVLRARYDEAALIANLKRVFGEQRTLGDDSLKTGLLIVTKRLDTGSPWPLGNNPSGKYFRAKKEDEWISNGDYPLWQVVRASTAAPSYFDPESITIAAVAGKTPQTGTFVDGGVSPFNNPSLQAFMYATLCGYRVNWTPRADRLLIVSVGTGMSDPSQAPSRIAAAGAIRALFSLMDDCATLVETVMQWMSKSATARAIDSDLGDCSDDLLGQSPLVSYLRYNVSLSPKDVEPLLPGLSTTQLASISEMDNPGNLDALFRLGDAVGAARVKDDHFASTFDLPRIHDAGSGRVKYAKRPDQAVVAVQVALEGVSFSYEKWGATQKCKPGDWLVDNDGDVYTVDQATFARTYQKVADGKYLKTTPVWAEAAGEAGQVRTKEGSTSYEAGDYLVFNEEDGGDPYAVDKAKFESMYEPIG